MSVSFFCYHESGKKKLFAIVPMDLLPEISHDELPHENMGRNKRKHEIRLYRHHWTFISLLSGMARTYSREVSFRRKIHETA